MARPERNTVDYFPFMCDEGKKMFYIEEVYGNDGFATFIKILRELAKTDFHYLNLSSIKTQMFLSAKCKVSKDILILIINDLAELGKFDLKLWIDYKIIWCQDFIDSIQDAYKKRNNECITFEGLHLLLHGLGVLNTPISTSTVSVKPQRKEKDIKENKSKPEYSVNAKILNEFSLRFFDHKYINEKSLESFDKLLLKYPIENIKIAIQKAKSDEFWTANFLSPLKLSSKDKTGVLYIDKFLGLKSAIIFNKNISKKVKYTLDGVEQTHYEKAYNENLISLGSERVKFLNYVEYGD